MAACEGCGASIDPHAEVCAYCKKVTLHGARMHDHRAHQERAAAHHRWAFWHYQRVQGVNQAQKVAVNALVWSFVGLIPCFFGVPSIVAIALAIRAGGEAKRHGQGIPGSAVGALVIGALMPSIFALAIVLGVMEDRRREERIAALQDEIEGEADGAKLSADVACKLAELELLQAGYNGEKDAKRVDCALAKLTKVDDGLALDNVRVTLGRFDKNLTFCLKKGQRWAVDRIVPVEAGCAPPVASWLVLSAVPAVPPPSVVPSIPASVGTATERLAPAKPKHGTPLAPKPPTRTVPKP